MLGGALIALLGMGFLTAALVGDSDNSDDETITLPPEEEDGDDSTSLLQAANALDDAEDPQVFQVTAPRSDDGILPTIDNFDPDADAIAFDIPMLAEGLTDDDGGPYFDDPARLSYDLTIQPHLKLDGTTVSLTLFDASNSGLEPVHFDVLVTGLDTLSSDVVTVTPAAAKPAPEDDETDATSSDTIPVTPEDSRIETGPEDDFIQGTARDADISAGAGDDLIDLDAVGTDINAGDGDDRVSVTGGLGNTVESGAGDDDVVVDLGTDVRGGDGTDTISVTVPNTPSAGLPLFLWNQPIEDSRFSEHSVVTLDDSLDTVHLNLAPDVTGHLHQVHLTQESFGTSSSEVYAHSFTLIVWTPEGVTDIADLVTGFNSDFNGSLAQDSAIGTSDYEEAANDPDAPRVIMTINHGTTFSGWNDPGSGSVAGAYDQTHDLRLVVNREMTSIHEGELY